MQTFFKVNIVTNNIIISTIDNGITTSIDNRIDGGSSNSVYFSPDHKDGGNATSTYTIYQHINGGGV